MKLVQKLSLALVAGTAAILAVNGAFRVRREVALFESDRVRDHRLIGNAVGAAVAAVWRTDGPRRALDLVEQANLREGKVHIRWTWLDDQGSQPRPNVGDAVVQALPQGGSTTLIQNDPSGQPTRYTYVPVLAGSSRGALELSESLKAERAYVRTSIIDTVLTTLLLALVCAGMVTVLGVFFVGGPMRSLTAKARRVGQGDFTDPLRLRQSDEIGELANEMNAMCERLVAANERVASETAARLTALEQLRHADRLLTVGKLASGVAHELGTPINVIEARATMIVAGETTPDEVPDYARVIVDSCGRMTKIIRQLLEFARRRGPQKAHRDLRDIARQTLDLLRPLAAKKGVALALRAPDEPVLADMDEGQMQQVLTNLVVNAVQAVGPSGDVSVTLGSERVKPPADRGGPEAEYRCVRVHDTGEGILPAHMPHLFEPFFTTKDVGEGTGLGLAVAYGIVRDHGGWIAVESAPGRGSDFSIYLPAAMP